MKRQEWNEKLMTDDEEAPTGTDERGLGGFGDTMWKYEQLRAGKLYSQFMFNSRQEAEAFATQMAQMAPDLFGRISPVEASAIWN